MEIKKISLGNIFIYTTFLMSIFPLLTFGTRSCITFIWSLLGIINFFKRKEISNFKKDIWIFILPFSLLALSLSYSENINNGIDSIVKMLSLLIIPLVFYLNKGFFLKEQIYKTLDFFSIAVLILVLFQIVEVLYNFDIISATLSLQEIKSNGFISINEITIEKIDQIKLRRFRNFIIKTSNTHTTYQGLWICFIVFYFGLKSYNSKKITIRIVYLIIIIVLMLWLYLISARMPFLALIVSCTTIIILFSKFSLRKKVFLALIPSLVLTVLLLFNNPFSTRIKEYYKTGFSLLEKNAKRKEFNSSNTRNGIYYCDLKLIKKAPFFGAGIGDVQDELNKCYKADLNAEIYKWHKYNTHNQYAFFLISSGLLGLLSFFLLIGNNFLKSFNKKNKLLFHITCLTCVLFLTENLLQRSDGLFFYCFFTGILFFNKIK